MSFQVLGWLTSQPYSRALSPIAARTRIKFERTKTARISQHSSLTISKKMAFSDEEGAGDHQHRSHEGEINKKKRKHREEGASNEIGMGKPLPLPLLSQPDLPE